MESIARQIFSEALERSRPDRLVQQAISVKGEKLCIEDKNWSISPRQVYAIAIGKASRPMARALLNKLSIEKNHILCITSDQDPKEAYCISSSHPIPDKRSVESADYLIQFINDIPDDSLILFALSGGASALTCKPAEGIALEDIKKMNQYLLESGAKIKEINSVRKHLSDIKGGQLLSYFKSGCTLIDLVISDVPGDSLEIIGSGPTSPDSSTFEDAYDTFQKYNLWNKCPESVTKYIKKGLRGEVPETIKPGHDPLNKHYSYIIGSAWQFAEAVAKVAKEKGFNTWIAESAYNQSVEKVADAIGKKIREYIEEARSPSALIFYGESTVKVSGLGKGGRNQELALYGALQIKGMRGITWLSAGTDGIDGPTDAAGAIVDYTTIQQAEKNGLNVHEYLQKNDSYHFHEQMGTLLKTGPTGNNVMDVTIVLFD